MIKTKCCWCGNIFNILEWRTKKYKSNCCCIECSSRLHSKNMTGKNHPRYKDRIIFKCAYCKKENSRPRYEYKNKKHHFCNSICMGNWYSENRIGKNHPTYIHGKSKCEYPKKFMSVRDNIRKRDELKCNICRLNQKSNIKKYNCKLSVHHIFYNRLDFNLKKLISLCSKCHAKTNTNRDYWIAYFCYILNYNIENIINN